MNRDEISPQCREIKRASVLASEIRETFEDAEVDNTFLSQTEIEACLSFLVEQHKEDWLVIDDRENDD